MSAPFKIKMAVRANPIITPITKPFVEAILKIAAHIKTVFRGTREFNRDVTEIAMTVQDIVNRKAGKKGTKRPSQEGWNRK